jgi:proteasome accessory factor B
MPPRAADVERAREPVAPAKVRRWLDTFAAASEDEKVLQVSYWVPARDEVTERLLSPYGYACRRGEWLLVAYCHTRSAVRVFYLRRVRALKAAAQRKGAEKLAYVKKPPGFDVRQWSRQEPWDYFGHDPVEAIVRFRGSLAKVAPKLVPEAKLSTAPDNSRLARFVVRNVDGLVRQCLAWGPEAEIVAPAEARDRARDMLASIGASERGAA